MNSVISIEEFKSDYLLALEEDLNQLESDILRLENVKEAEFSVCLYEILKKVHSYKGSAGSYEFYMLTTIFHRFEDHISAELEKPQGKVFIDLCLKYIDLAKNCLLDYKKNSKELEKYTTLIEGLSSSEKSLTGKVILIEPTLSIRKIIAKVCENNNLELTILNNGATALSRLLHERFDLIVSSLNIEIVDGESLLSGLSVMRNINQNTAKILISSNDETSTVSSYVFIRKDKDLLYKLDSIIKENIVPNLNKEIKDEFHFDNIVFVEDDPLIQKIIEKVFANHGKSLLMVGDFKAGMKAVLETEPDLIVLDYFLKDCVGTEILEHAFKKKGYISTPILFMTSTPEKVDLLSLKKWGNVKGLIEKPIRAGSLMKQIISLVK